jgi:predicted transcriptional regulator
MTDVNEIEIEVLRALTERGRLDEFQIASEANLALTSVEEALRSLHEQGVVEVSHVEQAPDRYAVNVEKLSEAV